jgi:hypothetical protein
MTEEEVWQIIDPDDMWILDKLILSKKLRYNCGPTGTDVHHSKYYVVRPCVNAFGLGLETQITYIKDSTDHLPPGHFWCEVFEGRHLSVDYHRGTQVLCVEGFKDSETFTRWREWKRTNDIILLPNILLSFVDKYEFINCEFIGGKLIEVHFRQNLDFVDNIEHFIPVWEGEGITPPAGYQYREYPDVHGRIGAFVK